MKTRTIMSELDKSSQQKKKRAPRGGTGVRDPLVHTFTAT